MNRVVALAGGVGGAKLADGLARCLPPGGLTMLVNTADDCTLHGLHVSPDLDTVLYTLAGLANPDTGWGLAGDTFWLVAAHGTQADYVRNLQAEPRVRVKVAGAWRAGTAAVLPGDDPAARSRTLPYQWDAALGRVMASTPVTIRIDLDPRPRREQDPGGLPPA